jgi:uncharacterized membrane protein HdeD (DUF308 family)
VPAPALAPARSGRYWIVALVRAVLALAVSAVITFTAEHSSSLGLILFGVFAVLTGIVVAIGGFTHDDRVVRRLAIAQGAVGVVAGVLAIIFNGAGLAVLLYTVSVWAALTGFIELYCGVRLRGRSLAARDWLVTGALTAVLAIVYLVIPPDKVLAVGLFGAYAVIVGVYVGIGAFTIKWGVSHPDQQQATESRA